MVTPEIEALARELTDADWEQRETGVVECPECGSWQADMGRGVSCEAVAIDSEDTCGYAPMPTRVKEAEALLAYVRELAAGLNTKQRNALTGWPQHPRPKLSPELGEYGGYSNASFQKTPLGCAVLRGLEE